MRSEKNKNKKACDLFAEQIHFYPPKDPFRSGLDAFLINFSTAIRLDIRLTVAPQHTSINASLPVSFVDSMNGMKGSMSFNLVTAA